MTLSPRLERNAATPEVQAGCPAGKPLRVALVGPDGVGKSTVIALLREWFAREHAGREFHVRQWRPCLLPDLGRFVGKPSGNKSVAPRREPGRLHWVRVLYYYCDFLLGSWWKDRLMVAPGALILYDRCALDMQVDPVRFALRSARGTDFLCRFTPQADVVILLEDDPERIWERKRELQRHEMREQLERWRGLAGSGKVHAIVRVNAAAGEIAARVRQIVLDRLPGGEPQSAPVNALESIERLCAGAPPEAARRQFAVLPHPATARFLAPLTPRAAAANSLQIYNPQTWKGRISRSCASLALRSGMAATWPKYTAEFALEDFQRLLARAAGLPEACVSISLGTPGVHRKPVFQVMDLKGRIRAFAKAGWNDASNRLVQREVDALLVLGRQEFSTASVPTLLDACWHNGNYVLVMAAAASIARPAAARLDQRHVRFLAELHAVPEMHLPDPEDRAGRVREAGFPYYADLLEQAQAMDRLPTGFGHGDFSPWNIRTDGRKLLVLDWEYGGEASPAGSDLFHFLIATGIELERRGGAELYRTVVRSGQVRDYWDALSLPEDCLRPALIAYLAGILGGNLLRYGNHPSNIDRQARRVWSEMLNLALRDGVAG